MPMLNKKPFERLELPTGCNPSEKVFYLEASNEIFTKYDEFFERTIQLNSTVWSCEFTGKTGLTFFEAQKSENDAIKALDDFPKYLEIPILFLVNKFCCRGRFEDLLNDIFSFMKDRYFIGEECFYIEGSKRRNVKIIGCSLVSEWSCEELKANVKELVMPPPESYRYNVQIMDDVVNPDDLSDDGLREGILFSSLGRAKHIASKPKLKLFLKNSCYINSEKYEVKDRFMRDGVVSCLMWELVLCGPLPHFPQTPMQQRGRQPKSNNQTTTGTPAANGYNEDTSTPNGKTPRRKSEGGRGSKLTEKKKQQVILQQEELLNTFEAARRLNLDLTRYEQTEKLLTNAEIATLKGEIKIARESEREVQKEARKQKIKAKYEWTKKRDDLDCDDLKVLPVYPALPLPDWLSEDDFAEYLVLLQFFNGFQELLPIKEIRGTSRVSLSDIIIAIRSGDPQVSPYADLMKILLSARTDRGDEEDGDEADLGNKEEVALIQLQNCDPIHPVFGDAIRDATNEHEAVRKTHGESVRHLPVDWMTLTEMLRLILITSGYYSGQNTHRHRLFQRGYYKGFEDAGFVFAREHPDIVEKLATSTVYELEAAERLALMKILVEQLLSYAKFRNMQEDNLHQIGELRRELKKLRNWDQTQEQEAKDARLAREYELEQIAESGDPDLKPEKIVPGKETLRIRTHLKAIREGKRTDRDELDTLLLAGVIFSELELLDIVPARDLQRAKVQSLEDQLLTNISDIACVSGHLHLGRDRAFRNYFLIESLPAIMVENPIEADHIGTCVEPSPVNDFADYGSEEAARHFLLSCSGNMSTCSVHGEGRKKRPRYSYISNMDTIDNLLAACNPRGLREIDLSDEVNLYRPRIEDIIKKTASKIQSGTFDLISLKEQPDPATHQDQLDWEQEMRELLLDLEEKMEQGLLGRLPSSIDRTEWRRLLVETGDVTPLIDGDVELKGTKEETIIWKKDELSELSLTQKLSIAFLQLVQGINLKFFRMPFVLTTPDEAGNLRVGNVFIRWQRELLQCRSSSAIALFLSTLEPAILWDKSRLQGKCRICRRKGVAESFVLCTDCNNCYHLECARMDASQPAPLDWLCTDCSASRRKLAAAEKRRAAKEAALENGVNDMYDDEGPDENSIDSEFDSSQSSINVSRTSSGRAIKKVNYKDINVPATPPLKMSKRNSTRTNGNSQQSVTEDEFDDETPYTRNSSTRRAVKRKYESPAPDTPIRGSSNGLRDQDASSREKISQLERIVRDAMKQEYAWPFLEPVDPKQVPDYYDIITRPIDLRTIINKVKNHTYDSPEDVRSDMYLLVANCKEYNEEGSEIYDCADQIETFFEDRLKTVFDFKKRRR